MSIRYRLIAMCFVVALVPAIPLSILVNNLLEKSFNVGLSKTMEDALESGMTVSRKHLDDLHVAFEVETGKVASLLPEISPDSSLVARAISDADAERGIDGFIMGSRDKSDATLSGFSDAPAFVSLVGGSQVAQRKPASEPGTGMTLYETEDRAVQLALWAPTRGSGSILFYKNVDPEFLAHAERVLQGRQVFAQLRLAQERLNRSFFYPFIIVYAIILVLALGFAFLMAERLARPVRRLVDATSAVARGDWRIQIKREVGGEIGTLVDSFNRMVGRLDTQRRRLSDLEKMASWREVGRHLAHEIKNPLLPIRLTVQEMKDQYPGGDERYGTLLTESVRVVEDELSHLQKLVKEFSSFARMPGLSPVEGSIEDLARDVSRLYPQVETTIEPDGELPRAIFDPDQLRRVLVNLFDNSVSMVGPEAPGMIEIEIRHEGDSIVLTFADNGPGIPAEYLPKIFDPYFSTRGEGSGLGLAMVKNIILLHGGTIEAASPEGGGAVFTITLPVRGPATNAGPEDDDVPGS
jgi:nitrogen fixation/metabolism regulation signal transduction histidine kinase